MKAKYTKTSRTRSRGIIAAAISISVLIAIVGIAYKMLADITDGTENFTGVKLQAAQNALDFDRSEYSPALFSNQTKQHVDRVEPSPRGKDSQGKPLRCTDDPNEIQYYSVTIQRVWLFGTTYGKITYPVCNTAG